MKTTDKASHWLITNLGSDQDNMFVIYTSWRVLQKLQGDTVLMSKNVFILIIFGR